jgi:hypothetical protein
MKVKLPKFECLCCGHKWNPRNEETPIRCAFCKSPYWNRASSEETDHAPAKAKHAEACLGCREK